MIKIIIYILLLLNGINAVIAQGSANEEYLKSNPSKQNFNDNHWKKIKKEMVREARGNAKENDKNFSQKDFEDNNQDASYYEYQEESFSGEYAQNNGEQSSDYTYKEENKQFKEGEGDNYIQYDKKDHDIEKGEYFSKLNEKGKSEQEVKSSKKDHNSGSGVGTFGSILLYTLLAIFLGVVVYFLFINTTLSDKGKSIQEIEIERAPVEITKSELELMLEKALGNNDYRLAIRIYFIFVLKDLSEKKWIIWKKEKTNYSYLTEMRGKKQYELFNEGVSIFELVWYGDYEISDKDYASIEPKFKTLLKELSIK